MLMALLMVFTTLNVFAHVSYITDNIDIPMRSSNEIQPSNLIRLLPSGTKLQLLSTENGWSNIELDNGAIGWIVSQYITSTKPTNIKLQEVTQSNKSLVMKNKKIKAKLDSVIDKCKKLRADLEVL
jgi:SH3 domain protein